MAIYGYDESIRRFSYAGRPADMTLYISLIRPLDIPTPMTLGRPTWDQSNGGHEGE